MEETKRELTQLIKKKIDLSETFLLFCQARHKRDDSEVLTEHLGFLYNLLKKVQQGANASVLCKEVEERVLAITTTNTDWVNIELDYMKMTEIQHWLAVLEQQQRREREGKK